MKLLVMSLVFALLATSIVIADEANMTFTSKSLNVAGGGNSPYFYGTATNNTSIMFFTPGKGEQRATLYWLNQIPLNTSVHVTYDNFIITNVSLISGNYT